MQINFTPSNGEKIIRCQERIKRLKIAISTSEDKARVESLELELAKRRAFIKSFLEE